MVKGEPGLSLYPSIVPPQGSGPLGEEQAALVRRSDCMLVASHLRPEDCGGLNGPTVGPDVSHRGGPPGFVQVLSMERLQWADYIGNYFFQTLGVRPARLHPMGKLAQIACACRAHCLYLACCKLGAACKRQAQLAWSHCDMPTSSARQSGCCLQ